MGKLYVLVLVLFFLVASCAVNPVTGKRELMFMPEEEELQWGEQMYPAVLWGEVGGGGKYIDPGLESYLSGIVKELHRVSHRPGLPIDFVVQDSSVPNAWAIPGHVSMTRGLLAYLENEAQFAFVMGHEIGHVAARHSAKQYTRGVLQSAALAGGSVFLGEDQGWAIQAASVGSALFLLRYSRSDELQADRLGVEYMAKAGYDPMQALKAHERLQIAIEEYRRNAGEGTPEENFLTDILSTHPRTKLRMEEVRETASRVEAGPLRGDGKRAAEFSKVTASLKEANKVYVHYDKAISLYREKKYGQAEAEIDLALRMDGSQAPFHNLMGLIHIKNGDYDDARRSIKRALYIYDEYQPAWQGLGLIEYERKNYEAAISPLEKSLSIFPQSLVSHYLLGMCLYRLGRYDEAIPHLDAVSQAAPRDPEIHGVLGISYDRVGEIKRAYEAYRLQVSVSPDSELGRHAAKRMAEIERMYMTPK